MKPPTCLFVWSFMAGALTPVFCPAESLKIQGSVTLNHVEGKALEEVEVYADGIFKTVSDAKGEITTHYAPPAEGVILEIHARKAGLTGINELEWQAIVASNPKARLQIVLSPENEATDRRDHYWTKRIREWLRVQNAPADSQDGLSNIAPLYGQWLARCSSTTKDTQWLQALGDWGIKTPQHALKALSEKQNPKKISDEERLNRYYLRTLFHISRQDFKAALQETEITLKLRPKDAITRITQGWLKSLMGEVAEARTIMETISRDEEVTPDWQWVAMASTALIGKPGENVSATISLLEKADTFGWKQLTGNLPYVEKRRIVGMRIHLALGTHVAWQDTFLAYRLAMEGLEMQRTLFAQYPDLQLEDFSEALDAAASLSLINKQFGQAKTLWQERLKIHKDRTAERPAFHLPLQAKALAKLAKVASLQLKNQEVIDLCEEGIECLSSLSQPRNQEGHLPLVTTLLVLQGEALFRLEKYPDAQASFKKALGFYHELSQMQPAKVEYVQELASTLQKLAGSYLDNHEDGAAGQTYAQAGILYNRLVNSGHQQYVSPAFFCIKNAAALEHNAAHAKEAIALIQLGLKYADKIEDAHPERHEDLAELCLLGGIYLLKNQEKEQASTLLRRSIRLYRDVSTQRPLKTPTQLVVALLSFHEISDSPEQRAPLLEEAEKVLKGLPPSPQTMQLRESLDTLIKAQNKTTL
jgi:tetratricopeptide (TPR) repeat protein